jgi:hypothetical protein
MRALLIGLALASVPAVANAQSTTIDFSSLAFSGSTASGPRGLASPLNLNGFTLTATDPFGLPPILVYSRESTNSADPGGAAIFANRSEPGITITRTNGGLFTFNGLDLTYAFNDQNAFNFDVSGLSSVRISSASPFQIDNVRLTAATAAVPEPSTWALMLIGFGAVGSSMRRRRTGRSLIQAA